jgi:uncharacterized protein with HEPN domain
MRPEDPAYLHHMLEAVLNIKNFSRNITSASVLRDRPLERAGIERMLTILGEAAKSLSPQLRRQFPDIPWRAIAGMRDKITHHYFGVDYEAVFETITVDIPVLKQGITAILDEVEDPEIPRKKTVKKNRVQKRNKPGTPL